MSDDIGNYSAVDYIIKRKSFTDKLSYAVD